MNFTRQSARAGRAGLVIFLGFLFGAALAGPAVQAASQKNAGEARFERFSYEGHAQEHVALKPGQYRNPVLSGYYPDPSVTRVGEDYYLVNSSFAHFPGLPVFHSKDLVTWSQVGNALDRTSQIDFKGRRVSQGVYAPDISYHDGLFYIVTTCVACGGNFVITAKSPAGPWSDPTWLDFDGIDPSIFWDDDGQAYIVNNGPPVGAPLYSGHRAIWVQAFDHMAMRLVGERTVIVNGGVDLSTKPSWIEGPHLLRKDGGYYLIAAEGGTGDNHSEVIFRAASVHGPYTPGPNNPILTQRGLDPARANPVTSAGHAKFVQTQKGDWWAVFLATRPYGGGLYNIGRETFLLPVTWKGGWPTILPAGEPIPFARQRPRLPAQPPARQPQSGDFSYVDSFDGKTLSAAWIGVRTPSSPFYRLENGDLVLSSGQPLGDLQGVPAFVARRQQHHVATVSTTVAYTPEKDGDRAGLAAVQNDRAYLFFGVSRIGGRRVVALYTRQNADQETLIASAPVDADRLDLVIRTNGGVMSFEYVAAGARRTLKADVDVTFLSTTKATGFVGTLIGPYLQSAAGR